MTAVALVIVGVGLILIWSAITGEDPIAAIVATVSGRRPAAVVS